MRVLRSNEAFLARNTLIQSVLILKGTALHLWIEEHVELRIAEISVSCWNPYHSKRPSADRGPCQKASTRSAISLVMVIVPFGSSQCTLRPIKDDAWKWHFPGREMILSFTPSSRSQASIAASVKACKTQTGGCVSVHLLGLEFPLCQQECFSPRSWAIN